MTVDHDLAHAIHAEFRHGVFRRIAGPVYGTEVTGVGVVETGVRGQVGEDAGADDLLEALRCRLFVLVQVLLLGLFLDLGDPFLDLHAAFHDFAVEVIVTTLRFDQLTEF